MTIFATICILYVFNSPVSIESDFKGFYFDYCKPIHIQQVCQVYCSCAGIITLSLKLKLLVACFVSNW